jgi:hypothetical protein
VNSTTKDISTKAGTVLEGNKSKEIVPLISAKSPENSNINYSKNTEYSFNIAVMDKTFEDTIKYEGIEGEKKKKKLIGALLIFKNMLIQTGLGKSYTANDIKEAFIKRYPSSELKNNVDKKKEDWVDIFQLLPTLTKIELKD